MTATKPPYEMPFTRVELCTLSVVDGRLCVLLGKRMEAPFKGLWALPGGVLRIDLDDDLDQAAQRIAQERLGLELPYLRQQCVVGGKGRDPRSIWALSVVYRALTPVENFHPSAGKRLEELKWFPVDAASADGGLAFDHLLIIAKAVSDLRAEVDRLDLPFEYLPEMFTLGELQEMCEQLLGHRLDKSSFRRRLDDRQFLIAVDGEFRRGANRPAQLFRQGS